MSEINLGAIQSIFDRYDTRQRLFQADLSRTTRKHSRKIRKETESLRLLRNQDQHKSAQDNRKQLFTTEMIGQTPPSWSLQLIPSIHQLPDLPRPEYYPTPNDIPTKRYSNPSLFDPKCLSPTGKRQLIKPLPKGWEECFITDQHEVLDMGVQQDVSQLDNFIHLPEIDSEFQKTLDLGRTYYYHKETGAVSFMPPPGSTKLAMEAFKNYGHIGLRQR